MEECKVLPMIARKEGLLPDKACPRNPGLKADLRGHREPTHDTVRSERPVVVFESI